MFQILYICYEKLNHIVLRHLHRYKYMFMVYLYTQRETDMNLCLCYICIPRKSLSVGCCQRLVYHLYCRHFFLYFSPHLSLSKQNLRFFVWWSTVSHSHRWLPIPFLYLTFFCLCSLVTFDQSKLTKPETTNHGFIFFIRNLFLSDKTKHFFSLPNSNRSLTLPNLLP